MNSSVPALEAALEQAKSSLHELFAKVPDQLLEAMIIEADRVRERYGPRAVLFGHMRTNQGAAAIDAFATIGFLELAISRIRARELERENG